MGESLQGSLEQENDLPETTKLKEFPEWLTYYVAY
jgi:hypothetical protein